MSIHRSNWSCRFGHPQNKTIIFTYRRIQTMVELKKELPEIFEEFAEQRKNSFRDQGG